LAILLSEGEGMSNFLLEAMACGLPTLTTQASALPDADGEKTGTCTLRREEIIPDGLRALNALAQDRKRLIELGQASRRHVEQNYSFERVGHAYLSLYRKMRS